ncbi:hypothetical protein pb186bvf_011971 [Paramecium bursaria]
MLKQVQGKSVCVNPFQQKSKSQSVTRLQTPTKDIEDIIQKYVGTDYQEELSTQRSITTMFHQVSNFEEERQVVVSPYKKLTEDEFQTFLNAFQKITNLQKSPIKRQFMEAELNDDLNHYHLQTNESCEIPNYISNQHSIEQIAQNLEEVFDSPEKYGHQKQSITPDKSPEFFNPQKESKIINQVQLEKVLPIIEESEEFKNESDQDQHNQQVMNRLNEMLSQINQKIQNRDFSQKIEQIKQKYEPKIPKEDEFKDFIEPLQAPQQQIQQQIVVPPSDVNQTRMLVRGLICFLVVIILGQLMMF